MPPELQFSSQQKCSILLHKFRTRSITIFAIRVKMLMRFVKRAEAVSVAVSVICFCRRDESL